MKLSYIMAIFAILHISSLANHGESLMTNLQTNPRKFIPEEEQKIISKFLMSNAESKKKYSSELNNYKTESSKLIKEFTEFNGEFAKFNNEFDKFNKEFADINRSIELANEVIATSQSIMKSKYATPGQKDIEEIRILQITESKKKIENRKVVLDSQKIVFYGRKTMLEKQKTTLDNRQDTLENKGKKLDDVVTDLPENPKSWTKEHFKMLATKKYGFGTFQAFAHLVKLTDPKSKDFGGQENKLKAEKILDTYLPNGQTRADFSQMIKNVVSENSNIIMKFINEK